MDIIPSALVEPRPADAAPPRVGSNRFHGLGDGFFTPLPPEPMPNPHWVATSPTCAALLDLPDDWAQRADLNALGVFSGNALWPAMQPLASVYSGHQFGVWAGQLGDGRALLLGEIDTRAGAMELQLKGAGSTPYSRMGDGRAVLRSSIREFLCSEAMHALGVPTTRALCITGSTLPVRREEIETAAVVTRVAPSFIRFGHFEHFAHHADAANPARLRTLADFVIEHHFPSCRDAAQPYAALLAQVAQRTALLMAHWQAVGFCHGVMNTDNMSILGLTIDYGPFGFLDAFDPGHICNHSDHQGRYAWARQPNVGFWNLHALGQALLPLIEDSDAALAAIETYKTTFADALLGHWRAKLGLQGTEADDRELADDLLRLMAADACDFTITFRRLAGFATGADATAAGADNANVRDLFIDREAFNTWAARYTARMLRDAGGASSLDADAQRALRMNRVNPKFVLRNHLADAAIRQARAGDFSEVERLQNVLARPFDEHSEDDTLRYAGFPPEWAKTIEVSCSS